MNSQAAWTPEKLEAFGREIHAIGARVKAELGPADLAHLKKIKHVSQLSEIIGRTLLHVSMDPVTWSAGVIALWIHLQLETTEIGHSALHGCWDGLEGAEKFKASTFKWNTPVDETAWKHEHNVMHHQFTNIVGRDPDINYGGLRVAEQTPWLPYHFIQLAQFFYTAPIFSWGVALYATGLADFVHAADSKYHANMLPDRKMKTLLKSLRRAGKKALPYALYQYGFWPLLAGPFWWKVLGGNLSAEVMRNIYSAATIFAGHFGDEVAYYDPDFQPRGRGGWCKAQIEAAHNFKVPHVMSLLCGALDFQIEHHLFPKLPPNRLREIAPEIQNLCKKYGLAYNVAGWGKNLSKTVARLTRMSWPQAHAA